MLNNKAAKPIEEILAHMANAADGFEGYTEPHAARIATVADALAEQFHLARADRASLRLAALAHDLGEAAMRRDYIGRAAALTAEDRLDLARHPVIGEQVAARTGASRAVQLLVRWHHEWWNGMGYPDALRGEQIPLAARILRVADTFVAITSSRPHRPALSVEEASQHLTDWAGLEFDPHIVHIFLARREFAESNAQ